MNPVAMPVDGRGGGGVPPVSPPWLRYWGAQTLQTDRQTTDRRTDDDIWR